MELGMSEDHSSGRRAGNGTASDPSATSGNAAETGENGGFLPDLLRRGLSIGFTGIFMTEEAVRRALGDSVPKDVIEFVLEQSERTRQEFLDRVSKEFGRALSAMDPVEIGKRLLEGRTIEVSARVRFVADDKSGSGSTASGAAASGSGEEDD